MWVRDGVSQNERYGSGTGAHIRSIPPIHAKMQVIHTVPYVWTTAEHLLPSDFVYLSCNNLIPSHLIISNPFESHHNLSHPSLLIKSKSNLIESDTNLGVW